MQTETAPSRADTNWGAVAILYLAGVLAACQIGKLAPLGGPIRAELEMSLAGFAAAMSIVQSLSIVFGVAGGLVALRFGGRRVLVAGLAVCAGGGLAAAAAPGGSSFLALRLLEGLGYIFVVVAAPTMLVSIAARRHRNLVLALWGTFFPVGIAVSGMLAGLWDGLWSWRFSAAIFSLAAGLVALVVIRLVSAQPGQPSAGGGGGVAARLLDAYRIRRLVLLTAGFGAFTTANVAMLTLFPTFLIEQRGWLPGQAGPAAAMVTLLSVPGSLLAGWILHKGAPPRRLATIVALVSALTIGPVWQAEIPVAAMLVLAALTMIAQGMIAAICFASLPAAAGAPRLLAPGNGMIVQMGSLGGTVGPPAVGLIATALGWGGAGAGMAACFIVSGLCMVLATRD